MFARRICLSAAIVASAATIVLAGVGPLTAQSARMEVRKIADNVYVMQHPTGSSNSMFVVTDEGVVIWDGDIRTADQVFAGIRRTTDKKVKYYIISHPAGDHATGGWHYREDQPVMISSRRQAKSLAEEELEEFTTRHNSNDPVYAPYHDSRLIQPNVTFDGSLTLRFGGLTFQITEEGSAHSISDLTLYIPERRVLAMGDLFKSETHTGPGDTAYKTFDGGKPFMAVADKIMARNLPVDTYVPGHGPVHVGRGIADLRELRRYFEAMRAEVSRMIKEGKTEQQVLAEFKTPAPFDKYGQAAGIVRFLPLYYRDLKADGVRP
ncbi:MAG: beta lactamase precursor [Acidobacteria bacterium]|nr:beta lactamase precursor [Acidobacteriota bacterium]